MGAVKDVLARVVLVEDEEIIRSVTMNYLETKGYQVRSFATADDALESFLVDDNVDVLLSDLVLPGKLNGVQLAVEMQNRKADVAVVFMSGYMRGKDSGLDASQIHSVYLRKPFAFEELIARITEVLKRPVSGVNF